MLYCTVICCAIPWHAMPCCTVLYCTVLCCATLCAVLFNCTYVISQLHLFTSFSAIFQIWMFGIKVKIWPHSLYSADLSWSIHVSILLSFFMVDMIKVVSLGAINREAKDLQVWTFPNHGEIEYQYLININMNIWSISISISDQYQYQYQYQYHENI